MTTLYDASIEADKIIDRCREVVLDESQLYESPLLDIFIMEGSSKLFLRSLTDYCRESGIISYVHNLEDSSSVNEELSKASSESDGVLFIRPPYSVESYDKVSEILRIFRSVVPDKLDVDRISYKVVDSDYPPVVESVRRMLEVYEAANGCSYRDQKISVIGNSTYVGKPMAAMVSDIFDQVIHLHKSTESKIISRYVLDSDVVITYRKLNHVDLNPDLFVIDVGDDSSYKSLDGRAGSVTIHLGKLTTAILLSNVVNNFYNRIHNNGGS